MNHKAPVAGCRNGLVNASYIIASSKQWHQESAISQNLFLESSFVWVRNKDELRRALEKLANVRYIFFLHWNWLVPEHIWSRYECVCFHMTDVPYGRGGSPLQNLIVRGHTNTQLTALRMVAEMDAGPVYTKRPLSLEGAAHEIYIKAGQLSYDIMQWMIEHEPVPTAQEGGAVIFERRKPEQSKLPETGHLKEIYNHIRMLDAPTYPHAYIEHGEFLLEFTGAVTHDDGLTASVRIRKKTGLNKT